MGFSICKDAHIQKDNPDLAYGRYEPAYTEIELLSIYKDLLGIQVQTPKLMESAKNESKAQIDDQTLVHSLVCRLDKHSPLEPGTSQSHTMNVDSQKPVTCYRQTVSRLAAVLQDPDNVADSAPSPLTDKAKQQILPSPREWTALIRQCVSVL